MINVLFWGIGGRMGAAVKAIIDNTQNVSLAGGVDAFADPRKFDIPVFKTAGEISVTPDVIIDFSRPEALADIIPYAVENSLPVVLCTTGYTDEDIKLIKKTSSKIAVFKTGNLSLGINLLIDLAKKAAAALGEKFDIEIIETHHNVKADAPSGTAFMIADAINEVCADKKEYVHGRSSKTRRREKKELGIHAVRGGTVVGKHSVLFLGNDEVITLTHEAGSKTVFAEGAVAAAQFIADKPAGMYDMKDLIESK